MKLLVVKTSSFGDIIHAMPALSDARRQLGDLVCDWLVEDAFAALPAWHPAVREVIPVSLRRWRRPPWVNHWSAMRRFVRRLRAREYDLVLDAQGLVKSAVLARLARGGRTGYDRHSAREPAAARLYDRTVNVAVQQHAIDRNRALFAAALGYTLPPDMDWGLRPPEAVEDAPAGDSDPYLVFIHGTTWPSKRWPLHYWRLLGEIATQAGWRVELVSGSLLEHDDSTRIARGLDNIHPVPPQSLDGLARLLHRARAVVSVDSGPGHLAAAVGTPGVSIYGATDPWLTGTRGPGQIHLVADFECAPCQRKQCRFADTGQVYPDCYATVPPVEVWSTLRDLVDTR